MSSRRSQRLAEIQMSQPGQETSSKRRRSQRTRQSPRGNAGFTELAQRIVGRKESVVFITGAGLSVASGVRPFRSAGRKHQVYHHHQGVGETEGLPPPAGLWDEVIWTTATRVAFRKDPLRWYNEFWLRHFFSSTSRTTPPRPNSGHVALDALLQEYPNVRQITQNIDGLQAPGEKIIEAHGRLGLYKCLADYDSDSGSEDDDTGRPVQLGNRRKAQRLSSMAKIPCKNGIKVCPYQYLQSLVEEDIVPTVVRTALTERCNRSLPTAPRCPLCNNAVLPQALLFDEGYHSHSFYQFTEIEDWLGAADAIVFVGTSFAVQLTQAALSAAREKHLPVYNLNTADALVATHRLNATNIVGPAVVSLPHLLAICRSLEDLPSSSAITAPKNDPKSVSQRPPTVHATTSFPSTCKEPEECGNGSKGGLRRSPRNGNR